MQPHWDIFCRVIDNYGDIGVCWRLARQLRAEHQLIVRLWVDDLASLAALCPGIDPKLQIQTAEGVEVRQWRHPFPPGEIPADVVVEAFACDLPDSYLEAMARRRPAPKWLNLEYLSAEAWVEGCHGLASPHPTLPLVKDFFFPGFTPKTGGLLREAGLLERRDAFVARLPTAKDALEVSLFCYEDAPVGELLETWSAGEQRIRCHVPPGKPLAAVQGHLGGTGPWSRGKLQVVPIPFVPQPDFDRLLWRCDVNFVRGEDSFVRAQWAAKPLVWHIYAQEDAAHVVKLDAFLHRYTRELPAPAADAMKRLSSAWNGRGDLPGAWQAFLGQRAVLTRHAEGWAKALAAQTGLAENLVKFCADKI